MSSSLPAINQSLQQLDWAWVEETDQLFYRPVQMPSAPENTHWEQLSIQQVLQHLDPHAQVPIKVASKLIYHIIKYRFGKLNEQEKEIIKPFIDRLIDTNRIYWNTAIESSTLTRKVKDLFSMRTIPTTDAVISLLFYKALSQKNEAMNTILLPKINTLLDWKTLKNMYPRFANHYSKEWQEPFNKQLIKFPLHALSNTAPEVTPIICRLLYLGANPNAKNTLGALPHLFIGNTFTDEQKVAFVRASKTVLDLRQYPYLEDALRCGHYAFATELIIQGAPIISSREKLEGFVGKEGTLTYVSPESAAPILYHLLTHPPLADLQKEQLVDQIITNFISSVLSSDHVQTVIDRLLYHTDQLSAQTNERLMFFLTCCMKRGIRTSSNIPITHALALNETVNRTLFENILGKMILSYPKLVEDVHQGRSLLDQVLIPHHKVNEELARMIANCGGKLSIKYLKMVLYNNLNGTDGPESFSIRLEMLTNKKPLKDTFALISHILLHGDPDSRRCLDQLTSSDYMKDLHPIFRTGSKLESLSALFYYMLLKTAPQKSLEDVKHLLEKIPLLIPEDTLRAKYPQSFLCDTHPLDKLFTHEHSSRFTIIQQAAMKGAAFDLNSKNVADLLRKEDPSAEEESCRDCLSEYCISSLKRKTLASKVNELIEVGKGQSLAKLYSRQSPYQKDVQLARKILLQQPPIVDSFLNAMTRRDLIQFAVLWSLDDQKPLFFCPDFTGALKNACTNKNIHFENQTPPSPQDDLIDRLSPMWVAEPDSVKFNEENPLDTIIKGAIDRTWRDQQQDLQDQQMETHQITMQHTNLEMKEPSPSMIPQPSSLNGVSTLPPAASDPCLYASISNPLLKTYNAWNLSSVIDKLSRQLPREIALQWLKSRVPDEYNFPLLVEQNRLIQLELIAIGKMRKQLRNHILSDEERRRLVNRFLKAPGIPFYSEISGITKIQDDYKQDILSILPDPTLSIDFDINIHSLPSAACDLSRRNKYLKEVLGIEDKRMNTESQQDENDLKLIMLQVLKCAGVVLSVDKKAFETAHLLETPRLIS